MTVLLATHNGLGFVGSQLSSILQQSGIKVRVVVSDDASTDGTVEWLKQKVEEDEGVTVLPAGSFGLAAKNFYRLIVEADIGGSSYVAFSDQDELWKPDKLSRAVRTLVAGSRGYSSDVLAFYPDGREAKVVKSQPQRQWDYLFSSAGPGCTYVVDAQPFAEFRSAVQQHWDAACRVDTMTG